MRAQYPGGAGAISRSDAQFYSLLINLKLLTKKILQNSPVLKTKLLGSVKTILFSLHTTYLEAISIF